MNRCIGYWVLILGLISPIWGIGTEGRSPHERPDWWKEYDNAKPIEVAPEVVPPKGEVPLVVEEAVTRYDPTLPDPSTYQPEGMHGTVGLPKAIEGEQVIKEASADLGRKPAPFWRPFVLFGSFFAVGLLAVLGVIRWLSSHLPEPPRPTRRRRF